jgi:hypothetical protein
LNDTKAPNFFIVGTGKAGTTSLHGYLNQHPQIYMCPVKEPAYFAAEIRAENLAAPMRSHVALQSRALAEILHDGRPDPEFGWIAAEWDDYTRLFQGVQDESAVGEATPAYLWSATAAANIHARVPGAKIVMMLRDPAERAYSQYLHQLSVGLTGCTFREHLRACAANREPVLSTLYPFLEVGMYYEQVKRFLDLFPREQIRIYWYEDAWKNPAALLADLFRFLGVDPAFPPDFAHRSHQRRAPRLVGLHHRLKTSGLWYPLKALVPERLLPWLRRFAFRRGRELQMDPQDRRYLVNYYRDDIGRLASLLGRDLSAWLR